MMARRPPVRPRRSRSPPSSSNSIRSRYRMLTSICNLQLDRPGGIEALTLREVPPPAAGPGQVLVRTVASTINPLDRKTRGKPDLPFPLTLGSDLAGIVVTSDIPGYRPGDRVIGLTFPKDDGIGA